MQWYTSKFQKKKEKREKTKLLYGGEQSLSESIRIKLQIKYAYAYAYAANCF